MVDLEFKAISTIHLKLNRKLHIRCSRLCTHFTLNQVHCQMERGRCLARLLLLHWPYRILYMYYISEEVERRREENRVGGRDISLDSFIRTGYELVCVCANICRKCQNCDRENGLVVDVVAFASISYQCPSISKFLPNLCINLISNVHRERQIPATHIPNLLLQSSYGISFWNVTA